MTRKHFNVSGEGRTEYDSKPFTARYDGQCQGDCAGPIEVGDEVSYVDDELMHVDCQPLSETQYRTNQCPDCNMMHAGECL